MVLPGSYSGDLERDRDSGRADERFKMACFVSFTGHVEFLTAVSRSSTPYFSVSCQSCDAFECDLELGGCFSVLVAHQTILTNFCPVCNLMIVCSLSWLQELGCRTSGLQQALGSHNQPVIHHIYRAQKEAASKKKATLKQTNKIAAVAAAAAGGTTSCSSSGRRSPAPGAIAEAPAHVVTDQILVRTAPPTFSPCPHPS
jgi:hypothetical protein